MSLCFFSEFHEGFFHHNNLDNCLVVVLICRHFNTHVILIINDTFCCELEEAPGSGESEGEVCEVLIKI